MMQNVFRLVLAVLCLGFAIFFGWGLTMGFDITMLMMLLVSLAVAGFCVKGAMGHSDQDQLDEEDTYSESW